MPATIMKIPLVRRVAAWAVLLESWYFDKRNNVETQATREEQIAGMADVSAGFWYLPTRPTTVHMLLKDLPMDSLSDYTFVDIGSGKGRVLLIAAQYGFRRVVGVEFRRELHERALLNVQRWRASNPRSTNIECLNMNARDYIFPNEKLVLYLFNPFGDEIMKDVLGHLD
ncbi:MAG TPA: class I SAM-dependent methyltransferase, partial [Bryobacteraceae bacterium]|nr:class I SAM-dependent methyltransferase [Bryobacteraceae bacterium]